MSTYKTRIDISEVDAFLSEKYQAKASPARFLKGGETSQAFSFEVDGRLFILRVNKHGTNNFEKDRYAFENFSSSAIRTPEILEIGRIGTNSFAISKMIEGDTLINLGEKTVKGLMPRFLEALDQIHSIDISSKPGYGILDAQGKGRANSWEEEILGISKQDWEERFRTTFMEREIYDRLYSKLKELIAFCPKERWLVHGDCSFDNVVSDGKNITGVIDWAQSMYGDFLYDIAWISFWPSSMEHASSFEEFYRKKGMPENYHKRILCYQVFFAINSLGFYAYSDQKDSYEWAKKRILSLM